MRRGPLSSNLGGGPRNTSAGRRNRAALSRQIALAAKPDVFVRFEQYHPEQMAEHIEPMAPRQPSKVGSSLRNQGRSLIRTALAAWFIGSRTSPLARGWTRPPAPCLGQKIQIQCRE
jgi:hypothetical protein